MLAYYISYLRVFLPLILQEGLLECWSKGQFPKEILSALQPEGHAAAPSTLQKSEKLNDTCADLIV